MKVTAIASPADVKQAAQTDSRARAIEAFNKSNGTPVAANNATAQEYPVQDANNISPEEVSAVKATTQTPETLDNNTVSEDTKVEVKAEEIAAVEEKPAPKDPAVVKQYAELSRQERILRAKAQKQTQELATQKAALDAQKAALDARTKEYEQGYISRDRLKADPLAVLAEANLSYDELTQQMMSQQPRDPRIEARMDRLEAENKALRQANEDNQNTYKQQQAESYQQAVKQIRNDAMNLVKAEPEAYEIIAKTKRVDDVVELIEKTYQKDGILLSVEEAAQEVESYLLDRSMETYQIDKIKKRLVESNASTKQETKQTQAKPQQTQAPMKTLTNATSGTRKLSARERALLAFKGELKS